MGKQQAALNIRRVIQKVRLANTVTIDLLTKELETVVAQDMEKTGDQKMTLMLEVEKAKEQAKKNIENQAKAKQNMQMDLEERKKLMEENKKKIEENKKKLEEDL